MKEQNKEKQIANRKLATEKKKPHSTLLNTKKKLNLKITFQDVIIIILLLSYLVIFYAYKHDIEQIQNITQQYKDIIENPQKLCYQYYEYLNQREIRREGTPKNLSELFSDLIIKDSNGK